MPATDHVEIRRQFFLQWGFQRLNSGVHNWQPLPLPVLENLSSPLQMVNEMKILFTWKVIYVKVYEHVMYVDVNTHVWAHVQKLKVLFLRSCIFFWKQFFSLGLGVWQLGWADWPKSPKNLWVFLSSMLILYVSLPGLYFAILPQPPNKLGLIGMCLDVQSSF